MLTHTQTQTYPPHKHTVPGKWVNVFIPLSFTQMLISWNSCLGPIMHFKKSIFTARGILCRSGQWASLLTHILPPCTDIKAVGFIVRQLTWTLFTMGP